MEFDPLQLADALDAPDAFASPEDAFASDAFASEALPVNDGFFPKLSAYSPQAAGSKMEGGYGAASKGPDGEPFVRTLDDYATGASKHVTLAGNRSQFGKEYVIPQMPYVNSQGQSVTLKDVRGVVHDTGGAFKKAGPERLDVAVGRNYNNQQLNAQPWSMRNNVQFRYR